MCKVTKNLRIFSKFDVEYFILVPVLDCQELKTYFYLTN